MSEEKDIPEHIKGAKFINHDEDAQEWMHYRDLNKYEISAKFRSRFRDLKGIISGQDIRDVLEFGDVWSAARGCTTFVMQKRGVLLYVVVTADIKDHLKNEEDDVIEVEELDLDIDDFNHTAVTIWPYIVDRDAAWMQGLSSSEIEKINEIQPELDY